MPLPMNRGRDGSRVTGLLLPRLPFHRRFTWPTHHRLPFPILLAYAFPNGFTRAGVKCDHARVRLTAYHNQEFISFQNWRASYSEKSRWNIPIGRRVSLPYQLAITQI